MTTYDELVKRLREDYDFRVSIVSRSYRETVPRLPLEAAAAIESLQRDNAALRERTIRECAAAAQMCAHGFTFDVDRRIHHNNAVSDCVDAINALAQKERTE